MITPRETRLLRAPDLRALHRRLAGLAAGTLEAIRSRAILVPSRAAAEELRRTLENLVVSGRGGAMVLPDLLTRDELHARLHERAPDPPRLLTAFEREVILRGAARAAVQAGAAPPFQLRPALVAAILEFYDELRRRGRTIDGFDRLMTAALEPGIEIDRGAERLLQQTRFLAAAFEEFERRTAATGATDEHGLRAWLITGGVPPGYRHLIVTVGDQAAEPAGLWPADFDLLSRLPGLERLDVCATEGLLAAGLHQRLHDLLPGIEEEQEAVPSDPPVLIVPDPGQAAPAPHWFTCRDREEELADVVRRLRDGGEAAAVNRVAVVFQRPLPYLYLARQVFADGQAPYQTLEALPLAAEPFAAAIDMVFAVAIGEATRASLVELLGSPHWRFDASGGALGDADVAGLDDLLLARKYLGGWDALEALAPAAASLAAGERPRRGSHPAVALQAAVAAGREIRRIVEGPSASRQIDALVAFIRSRERLPPRDAGWHDRHLRARAAVLAALTALGEAHAAHDDGPLPIDELAGTVRRWIEGQTFSPRAGAGGVILADARAAAYADVDEVRLVGFVEADWPERTRRNIFYPAGLLAELGWHAETDRLAAARAHFRDLLHLPRTRVSVSTFALEDDAIVAPSPLLEELHQVSLQVERVPMARPATRDFVHEALMEAPVAPSVVDGPAAAWLSFRLDRSDADPGRFQGQVGTRPGSVYAVSSLERYLECPFKYFAAHVMRLPEEREEQAGLTPRERGHLLHEIFQQFFARWQAYGRGAITARNLEEALASFEQMAEQHLARLSETDRALERTHLLGSAVAPGLAERAFAFELEQDAEVLERLLEHPLEGEFVFPAAGAVSVRLRAKADRIDLLADGTLRVVDYKLGRAPRPARALQLPVYGVCAEQQLEGRHGRSWRIGRAGYVAFKEKRPFVALGGPGGLERALADGQARLVAAVQAIEQGRFPVEPDEPFLCTRCSYATVCRKDYVGDE